MNRSLVVFALVSNLLTAWLQPAVAQRGDARPDPSQTNEVRIGDATIDHFLHINGLTNSSRGRIVGPNTVITVPDKKSGSVLVVHADDVVTQRVADDYFGRVELSGHVRYRIRRKAQAGVSTLVGTAGHGLIRHSDRQVDLTEGVRATFTDSEHFASPGEIEAGSVTIDIGALPYRYTLAGKPSANRIQFQPLDKKSGTSAGDITVQGYDTGVFQAGRTVRFEGSSTTADMVSPRRESVIHLRADQIFGQFDEDGTALDQVEAAGGVTYKLTRTKRSTGTVQSIDGTCSRAVWSISDDKATLSGAVRAVITDPDTLQDPARVFVDRVVASTTEPYHYDMTGVQDCAQIVFTPRPKPPAKGAAAATRPPSPGTIRVVDFDSGTFVPGQSAVIAGSRTVLLYSDAVAQAKVRVRSALVTAKMAADGTLASATAAGSAAKPGIVFYAEQTVPAKDADAKSELQTVHGTALDLQVTNSAPPSSGKRDAAQGAFDIRVDGPFHAAMTGIEGFGGPVNVVGIAGDSVVLTQTPQGYACSLDSPKETVTIEGPPKQAGPDRQAPAAR